jgi:hypothetical protein
VFGEAKFDVRKGPGFYISGAAATRRSLSANIPAVLNLWQKVQA